MIVQTTNIVTHIIDPAECRLKITFHNSSSLDQVIMFLDLFLQLVHFVTENAVVHDDTYDCYEERCSGRYECDCYLCLHDVTYLNN